MNDKDKRDIAVFGFRKKGKKGPARAVLAVSILVIIFAVWFVVIRH